MNGLLKRYGNSNRVGPRRAALMGQSERGFLFPLPVFIVGLIEKANVILYLIPVQCCAPIVGRVLAYATPKYAKAGPDCGGSFTKYSQYQRNSGIFHAEGYRSLPI